MKNDRIFELLVQKLFGEKSKSGVAKPDYVPETEERKSLVDGRKKKK